MRKVSAAKPLKLLNKNIKDKMKALTINYWFIIYFDNIENVIHKNM